MLKLTNKNGLIVFLGVLLLASFSLTSILSYQVSRTAVHDGIMRNQLPLVGDNVYSEIQRDILRPVFISSVMAQDAFLRGWVLEGEKEEALVRRFLREIQERYQTVTSFFVSENTKTYYHSTGVLKQISSEEPRDKWYYQVRALDADYKIDVDFDAANSDAVTIFVNYKMFDFDGNFIGVTGVGLAVEAVGKLIERYQNRFQRRIYFVDPSGRTVLPTQTADSERTNIRKVPGLRDHADQVLSKKTVTVAYQANGDTVFVAARYIPELNWTLVVEQSDSEAVGGLKNTLFINLAISLFATIIVLALTFFAISTYSHALVNAAELEKETNNRLTHLNNQKDKLLSIIGHDLRAPFTAFLGLAEILGEKAKEMKPADVADYANDVLKSGRIAYGLLESLLNWANVQWEDLSAKPEKCDVSEIIQDSVEVFGKIAERKNIKIERANDASLFVFSDRNMCNLIVRNLVNNAVKFTERGGTVTIEMTTDGDYAWISIADTGIGIEPDQLDVLTRPDHKLSKTGTDGEMGIGMGLSLCVQMIKANGGEMKATSEPGKGSEFKFSLPLADSAN